MAEEKVRFQMRIDPNTDRKIKAAMPLANCRSQNEFVQKALNFYCDYLTAGDCTSVLPPIYLSALKATIKATEERISRLMFKQSVEMDMRVDGDQRGHAAGSPGALCPECKEDQRQCHPGKGRGVPARRMI